MVLWAVLAGCVVGITGDVVLYEPVERVEVRLAEGDLRIEASLDDRSTVRFTRAGFGHGSSVARVTDGVLHVPDPCAHSELCTVSVSVAVPPDADVDVTLGSGTLRVRDMGGELLADVAGRVEITRHTGPWIDVSSTAAAGVLLELDAVPERVEACTRAGGIRASVPPGRYALDLQAGGAITVDPGVEVDPDSSSALILTTEHGPLTVHAR